jgi:Xaa-Pro aminopeptidase
MKEIPLVFWSCPENDANLKYCTKFSAPDNILAIYKDHKWIGVINALEFGRAQIDSGFDEILSWEKIFEDAKKRSAPQTSGVQQILLQLLESWKLNSIQVPENFPVKLAFELTEAGVEVLIAKSPLFSERETKSPEELDFIRYGNQCSASGILKAAQILRDSRIGEGGILYYRGKILTSEIVHFHIAVACLEMGAISSNTIVAGGDQACDPHHHGSGPLKANELIIVDVFPKVESTGYHGDMTRTFLKGSPSKEQTSLVEAVRSAQQNAFKKIRSGVTGDEVHKEVQETFTDLNFKTFKDEKGYKGFFHGTGHGLGLEVHESPRVSFDAPALKSGHVITVEPGLYYPGLGGVRIEDVVVVSEDAYEMLSNCSYDWVIQ